MSSSVKPSARASFLISANSRRNGWLSRGLRPTSSLTIRPTLRRRVSSWRIEAASGVTSISMRTLSSINAAPGSVLDNRWCIAVSAKVDFHFAGARPSPRPSPRRRRGEGGTRAKRGRVRARYGGMNLPHRGERRRDQQLVFLADRPHPALGGPAGAGAAGFVANPGALGQILVDPGVDEFIEPAQFARPAGRQRGELLPRLDGLGPRLQYLRDIARRVGV